MKTQFLLLIPALLLAGCTGVKEVGQVGNVTFYRANVRGFSGPNITALISERDGVVKIETAATGGGIGHTIVSAAGHVGAAAAFGLSLRPDEYNVSNGNTGGNSSASATGNGGNSSATGGNGNGGSATGGNGNGGQGGNGGSGGNGGAGGHPDSPGNGGVPGNGGQNPNKP